MEHLLTGVTTPTTQFVDPIAYIKRLEQRIANIENWQRDTANPTMSNNQTRSVQAYNIGEEVKKQVSDILRRAFGVSNVGEVEDQIVEIIEQRANEAINKASVVYENANEAMKRAQTAYNTAVGALDRAKKSWNTQIDFFRSSFNSIRTETYYLYHAYNDYVTSWSVWADNLKKRVTSMYNEAKNVWSFRFLGTTYSLMKRPLTFAGLANDAVKYVGDIFVSSTGHMDNIKTRHGKLHNNFAALYNNILKMGKV